MKTTIATALTTALCVLGCSGGEETDFSKLEREAVSRVTVDRTYLRDESNRYVQFNGVNVGGSTKVPYTVDPLTYVGRPFPLKDADAHFAQIKSLGFNSIRLLWIWEAVEPSEKGVYDTEFLDFFEQLIAKAQKHGLYVLINLHENLFSRHLFVHFNDSTDRFYNSYCRSDATGKADWSKQCQSDAKCGEGFSCTLPLKTERNVIVDSILSVLPDFSLPGADRNKPETLFTDRTQGDGAPLWAAKACLPEKNLDSKAWGYFKILGNLLDNVDTLLELMSGNMVEGDGPGINTSAIISTMTQASLPTSIFPQSVSGSTDMMPWTLWGMNMAFSGDVHRCYMAYFAGKQVYPDLKYEMPDGSTANVEEYLQSSVEGSWREIAKRAAKYDNVIGYDLMNEPASAYLTATATAALIQGGRGVVDGLVSGLLGPETGAVASDLLFGLGLLPPVPARPTPPEEPEPLERLKGETNEEFKARQDARNEALKEYNQVLLPQYKIKLAKWEEKRDEIAMNWGYGDADLMAMLGLLIGFDKNHLQPLYERVGRAIQEEDPNAIIWIEESAGFNMVLGDPEGNGVMEMNMTRPEGIDQVVFAPHWYPDIYPFIGFNVNPRQFTALEWEYRDWAEPLISRAFRARYSLGNVPIVYGEFGTYFNFNGIDWSVENNYIVSEQILDNYYEAFEEVGYSRMVWCYTADNDRMYGDNWNKEDFSILDFDGKPRARRIYDRPFARALAGKPIHSHFYSDLHYFDPQKGIANPHREYVLEYESKESDAPTVIHVPHIQYPMGFFVWLSDGYALYNDEAQTLYHYPTEDSPGHVHFVVIRPNEPDRDRVPDLDGWRYFFDGDKVVEHTGGVK